MRGLIYTKSRGVASRVATAPTASGCAPDASNLLRPASAPRSSQACRARATLAQKAPDYWSNQLFGIAGLGMGGTVVKERAADRDRQRRVASQGRDLSADVIAVTSVRPAASLAKAVRTSLRGGHGVAGRSRSAAARRAWTRRSRRGGGLQVYAYGIPVCTLVCVFESSPARRPRRLKELHPSEDRTRLRARLNYWIYPSSGGKPASGKKRSAQRPETPKIRKPKAPKLSQTREAKTQTSENPSAPKPW